jgi:prepilin-type N-terminal cleavage/methylation domain-containing protein
MHAAPSSLWMPAAPAHSPRAGFTLVELLIVTMIVGILAAVAVPQFGNSAAEARLASLDQNLAAMRKAIERYYYEHNSRYPGHVISVHKADLTAVSVEHADLTDAFTRQLTQYSDATGRTSAVKDAAYPYGPYLRKMPENPLAADSAVSRAGAVSVVADTAPLRADVKPATGWKASSATGQIIANHTEYANR